MTPYKVSSDVGDIDCTFCAETDNIAFISCTLFYAFVVHFVVHLDVSHKVGLMGLLMLS